jgi:hypothetical protein
MASSFFHKQSKRAGGTLVQAVNWHLRQGDRWGAPGGKRVPRISARRIAAGGVLVAALVALFPPVASAQPSPDPFRSGPATPSSPKPDPAPDTAPSQAAPDAAGTSTVTRSAPSNPAPATTAPAPRPAPVIRSTPVQRGATDLRAVTHRPGESARRALAVAAAEDGRPAALAAFALLVLALAGGSLLHVLARDELPWGRA